MVGGYKATSHYKPRTGPTFRRKHGPRPGALVLGETEVQGGRGEQDPAEPDQVRGEGQGLRDGQQGRLKRVLFLRLPAQDRDPQAHGPGRPEEQLGCDDDQAGDDLLAEAGGGPGSGGAVWR